MNAVKPMTAPNTATTDAAHLLNLCDLMTQGMACLERSLAGRGLLVHERHRKLAVARAALGMALDFLPDSPGQATSEVSESSAVTALWDLDGARAH